MKYLFVAVLLSVQVAHVYGQDSLPKLSLSGYVEVYYSYDLNRPADHNKASFLYNYNRHNEFSVNLSFLKAAYTAEKVRANLAIAAGSYMNANYAAEPGVLKNIMEANAGVRIGKKNCWLDAGVLPSHIGFESAVGQDCRTLTRSIGAENSPYYETGARLSFTDNRERWSVALLALNGWQRIQRVDGNSAVSWGAQVQFHPSQKLLLNYSGFAGTDKPDSARLDRFFNDVYGVFTINEHWAVTTGFDVGVEQRTPGSGRMNTWYTPVAIVRLTVNDQFAIAARGEYYHDPAQVLVTTSSAGGFCAAGYSCNLDYHPAKNASVRFEVRQLRSTDPVFEEGEQLRRHQTTITASLAVGF